MPPIPRLRRVTFRLAAELHNELDELAVKRGLNVDDLIADLVTRELADDRLQRARPSGNVRRLAAAAGRGWRA